MTEKNKENPPYLIQVLDKCLNMLEIIGGYRNGITLSELVRLMGLPKSSLFRYLATFEHHGYVERTENERFKLGVKLLELGGIVHANLDIREQALPAMRILLDQYQETVNLAVLDGNEIIYIEMLESSQALRMAAQRGSRDMAHSTALGKALLAFLDRDKLEHIIAETVLVKRTANSITSADALRAELEAVRALGYAKDVMENEDGVCCVSAPIFNQEGRPVAAISISGPSYRLEKGQLDAMGQGIREQARLISEKLGYLRS